MYIEQIRKHMNDNEFIKPHPPANLKIITNAENRLRVMFPNELKELLLEMDGDNCLWRKWLRRLLLLFNTG